MKHDLNSDVFVGLEAIAKRDITHIFLVACGGSLSIMYPGKYFLDTHLDKLGSDVYNSAEFMARGLKKLDNHALVILCSQTGTTKETCQAAAYARSKGALTIALTMESASSLAQEVDHIVLYQSPYTTAATMDAANSNYAVLYMLLSGILRTYDKKDTMVSSLLSSLDGLQETIDKAHIHYAKMFDLYAQNYERADVIYTVGSGVNYGAAYSFAICVLMEMLWINSQAIHANEFFHGPFEVVDEHAKFILMLGLDETRVLEERTRDFLNRFGAKDNILIMDARELDLSKLDAVFRPYFVPLIFFDILWKFAYQLADRRNHIMLEGRRYMKKLVDY